MIKSQEKYMRQLALVMLALGIVNLITGEERIEIIFSFSLSIAFDMRAHLYRIQDDIKNLKQ